MGKCAYLSFKLKAAMYPRFSPLTTRQQSPSYTHFPVYFIMETIKLKRKITVIIGSGSRKYIRLLHSKIGGIFVRPYCESSVEDIDCPDFEELVRREAEVLESYAKRMSLRLNEPIMPLSLLEDVDGPFINILRTLKRAYCLAKNERIVLFLEDGDAGINALQQFTVGRIIARAVESVNLYVVANVNSIDYLRGLTTDDMAIYVVMRDKNNEMVPIEYVRRDIVPPFFEAAALAISVSHPED